MLSIHVIMAPTVASSPLLDGAKANWLLFKISFLSFSAPLLVALCVSLRRTLVPLEELQCYFTASQDFDSVKEQEAQIYTCPVSSFIPSWVKYILVVNRNMKNEP